MSRQKQRVLDFYASKSWAILEENLQEMFEIYKAAIERKALDTEFDPEALSARVGRPLDNTRTVTTRDGIAILPVVGPLMRYANIFTEISGATSIEMLALEFNQALSDRTVKAIVLEINSPGGEVDGTSELAQMIFNARGQKPITAYAGHLAASAAYWLASACDEIVCADTASLGSIGVVGGVRTSKDKSLIEFVSSQSPNKRPDPQTESGRAQFQAHVDALAEVFIETVARNRDMSAEDVVSGGGSGGLKVGRLAVEAGLADRIGTLEETISELALSGKPRPRAKNLKLAAVVDLHAGEQPPTKPTIGVDTMANETNPETDAAKAEAASKTEKADLDKTIGERISAFFSEKFGASAAAPAVPVATKADENAEANRQGIQRAQAEAEAAKKEAAEAKAQIALLQKSARATRFESLAKTWPGEPAKHVAMLELLSQSCEGGEESQHFKDYVIQHNAIAEQLKTASLFAEVGSSAPAEGSAAAVVAAKVKALRDVDSKLTEEQAFAKVWAENPELRKQYRAEERVN